MFTFLALFAKQREDALAALRGEQAAGRDPAPQHPAGSIAERLKAQPETIADQFTRRVGPVRRRRRLHAALGAPVARPRSSACSTACSATSTPSRSATGSRRSRRSATPTWSRAGVPNPRPDHAQALAHLALDMLDARLRRRRRRPRPPAPHRHQFGPGRGRRHRPQAVPVRPVGGRGQHRQPDGVARHARTASRSRAPPTSSSKDEFVCEPRGTVTVKGKGEMETWYLVGRRPDRSAEAEPELAAASAASASSARGRSRRGATRRARP